MGEVKESMTASMTEDRGLNRLRDPGRARARAGARAQRETGDRRNGWGAVFRSVLRHRLSHLSSVIDSVIFHFQVAGGSSGWPVAGFIHSALHSALNADLHAVPQLASVIRHRFSPPRSPPFSPPWSTEATRAARGAAPTSRQCPEITKNEKRRTKNQEQSRFPSANRQNLLHFPVFHPYAPPYPAPRPARLAPALRG